MKTLTLRNLGLSILTMAFISGCNVDQTQSSSVVRGTTVQTENNVEETTDTSKESVPTNFESELIGSELAEGNTAGAVKEDISNVNFSLKSVHFQTVPAQTKNVQSSKNLTNSAQQDEYEIFSGKLSALELNTNNLEEFDWIAKIDESGMVALSNKTLLLNPGDYKLELILENGARQYVGTSDVSVADKDQIEVNFGLHAVIGDVITDITAINGLASFELNFPNDELAEFDIPRIGVIVNGGDENVYTINKDDGKPEGVINIVKGDEVFMKFYDGGLQKGKSNVVTAVGGETMEITFKPIYGEVDVQGIGDSNGTIAMGFKVPNEIIEEAGEVDNVSALLTYLNGSTYNEVELELTSGDGAYDANYTIVDATYDTLGYSVVFTTVNTNEELGRCTQEAFDLTKDEMTKSCQIDLKRGIVMNASFEGVAGFNVYDELGDALEGMSIFADNEFIGFTGSGTFGSKGYIKSYFKPDTYVIKAVSEAREYAKEVTIKPLSVNNYEFLVPSGIPEGAATLGKSVFTTASGQSETTDLTVTNAGKGVLFYEVTIVTEQGTNVKVVKRAVPKTGNTVILGKTANNLTGLMTFDYVTNGDVDSKTINYKETNNRVIIKYKDGTSKLKSAGGSKPSGFEVQKLDVNSAGEYMMGVNALLSDPDVEYVEPDQILNMLNYQNEPLFNLQWGHHNEGATYGYDDVDVDWKEVQDKGHELSTVIVGVIDSGVQYTHPDLAANMWKNPGEVANNGIDDDGNGYIDDVYGYDFYDNDNDPMDENGHGTHVSGIIAAPLNGIGVVGVNSTSAKIMALRFLGPTGSGYTSGAVKAIEYAINNGAHLTNNSWGGGGFSVALRDMIIQAQSANQLFVVAAGNDNENLDSSAHYPASLDLDNMIIVGSSDYNDDKSSFSNYSTVTVDLLAPGSQIASTYTGNQYVYASGTSMASPYVAGVASLLVGKNTEAPYEVIKQAILENGDQTPAALAYTSSGKRLNANLAMNAFDPDQEWIILTGDLTGELAESESKIIEVKVDASQLNSGSSRNADINISFTSNSTTLPVTLNVQ